MNIPVIFEEEELTVEVTIDGNLENVLIRKIPSCVW
jgi:hypothetical protein